MTGHCLRDFCLGLYNCLGFGCRLQDDLSSGINIFLSRRTGPECHFVWITSVCKKKDTSDWKRMLFDMFFFIWCWLHGRLWTFLSFSIPKRKKFYNFISTNLISYIYFRIDLILNTILLLLKTNMLYTPSN